MLKILVRVGDVLPWIRVDCQQHSPGDVLSFILFVCNARGAGRKLEGQGHWGMKNKAPLLPCIIPALDTL
jgi:hypothetical protein